MKKETQKIKKTFEGRDPDKVWKELSNSPNAKTISKEELFRKLIAKRDAYRAAQAEKNKIKT